MTDFIKVEQGTLAWFEARIGAITASMFTECRTKVNDINAQQKKYADLVLRGMDEKEAATEAGYKAKPKAAVIEKYMNGEQVGDFTEAAKAYAFKLAVERISGRYMEEEVFTPWQARRGNELEPEARRLYEKRTSTLVEQTGLALTDDRLFGSSLDGLVDDDGSLEIKCFLAPAKIAPIIFYGDVGDVKDQMQGGMWVTGRKWCDFALYCPALECIDKHLTIIRFERDDDYIAELEADLLKFNDLVNSYIDKLRA